MTTTLEYTKQPAAPVLERQPPTVLEPPEGLEVPEVWHEAPLVEPEPKPRVWPKLLAVGVLSGVIGLTAGYGIASAVNADQIARLESQQSLMLTVPYGGFQSEYGAVREHLALADSLAALPSSTYGTEYSAPREHQALVDSLEAQEASTSYGTEYSAPREHQALVDSLEVQE